ncbi:hypothetical protein FNV43_RR04466 [Rhamnella rubrinervis]|uniref:Uncharacterized protein n=1 Tax=Rhamnella rubrinervis TaxID=2594499 RepID=A0A8K0HJM5_9ROSA|nr:hypothetical protein FNV43_RR04466 [Rhamnella rubrinervis]
MLERNSLDFDTAFWVVHRLASYAYRVQVLELLGLSLRFVHGSDRGSGEASLVAGLRSVLPWWFLLGSIVGCDLAAPPNNYKASSSWGLFLYGFVAVIMASFDSAWEMPVKVMNFSNCSTGMDTMGSVYDLGFGKSQVGKQLTSGGFKNLIEKSGIEIQNEKIKTNTTFWRDNNCEKWVYL